MFEISAALFLFVLFFVLTNVFGLITVKCFQRWRNGKAVTMDPIDFGIFILSMFFVMIFMFCTVVFMDNYILYG